MAKHRANMERNTVAAPNPNTNMNTERNTVASARTTTAPTHEQIARRAYEIWLRRGRTHGHHLSDWQQAERELRGEPNA